MVINTGTHATIDATPGLLEAKPLTHVEALELDRTPEHLLVLGGGFVGLEFAQAMRRYSGRPISENSFSSLTLPAVYVNPRYSKASDKYIDLKEANFDAQRCAALAGMNLAMELSSACDTESHASMNQ